MGSPDAATTDSYFFLSRLCNEPFWDVRAAWESPVPDFGKCVERTVLVWTPCLLLWLSTVLYLLSLTRRPLDPAPWSALSYTKVMVSVLVVVTAGVEVVWAFVEGPMVVVPADYLASLVLLLTQVLHLVLVMEGRKRSERNSLVLWLFWLLMVLCGVPQLYTTISTVLHGDHKLPTTLIVTFLVQYLSSVALFVTNCFSDAPSPLQRLSMTQKPSPELNASILSRLLFFWSIPIIWHGWVNTVSFQDLWDVVPDNTATAVYHTWLSSAQRGEERTGRESCNHLENTIPKMKKSRKMRNKGSVAITAPPEARQVSIVYRLWAMMKLPFLMALFLSFISEALRFITPKLLSNLIGFITDKSEPAWHGYLYAVALFIVCELASLLRNAYFNTVLILSVRVRSTLMSAVYTKALKLSGWARRESTVGQMVNLMAVDTQTVGDTLLHLCSLFISPVIILVSLAFLWEKLGPSVLAGLVVLLLVIPINSVLVKKSRDLQSKARAFKDKRVKLASEIINGIKVLKLYAWEAAFAGRVQEVRNKEISLLRKLALLESIGTLVFNVTPYLVALVTFTTYLLVSENNVLDAQKAFVSIALFNLMRMPIIQMPNVISQLIQASVALKRLQKYVMASELDPEAVCYEPSTPGVVVVRGGQFSWEGEEGEAVWSLKQVELEVMEKQLVAVVGPVGAGKSSLISALLGEMRKDAGKVVINGSVAYVSQQAWLQNATLRDNITWGQPFYLQRYRRVVKACALQPDIDMLPAGDMTEIGEKGINVSGGQKQRVALARAVYSDASIILLDDPLSAVDSHVGRHIFHHVIGPQGMLKDKTRVLVTHAVTFLPQVDTVVVMREGRLMETGTYAHLLDSGGDFAQFILQHLHSMDNEQVEEELDELCDHLEEPGGKQLLNDLSRRRSSLNNPRIKEEGRHRTVSETDAGHRTVSETDAGHRTVSETDAGHRTVSETDAGHRTVSETDAGHRTVSETDAGPGNTYTPTTLAKHSNTLARSNSIPTFLGNSVCSTSLHDNVSTHSNTTSTMSRMTTTDEAQLGQYDFVEDNSSLRRGQILVEDETAETGKIASHVYIVYGRAMGVLYIVMPVIFITLAHASNAGSSVLLSQWSSASNTTIMSNSNTSNITQDVTQVSRDTFLAGYGAFGVGQAIFLIMGVLMVTLGGLRAANTLHHHLLDNIIRLPMSFYDTNPSGRIINRFSKEVDVLDYILPVLLRACLNITATVVMTMVVIIAATPMASIFIVPIMCLYCFIQQVFVATSRQLQRIESITKSPIFSYFSESIQGASVIRAFKKQDEFFSELLRLLENNLKPLYTTVGVNRCLCVLLESMGNIITFAAAILGVASREDISPGVVGLSITYSLSITFQLNWLVRIMSDVEAKIVSVERINEYIQIAQEAAWRVAKDQTPSVSWPSEGRVTFTNYETRYRPGLDIVLKGISCSFRPAEKVGIVGRTGAGKSSLTLALFRIIEASEGHIDIDGVNIAKIGLHDLRGHISIIPQDPVLFSGTLRLNLDPFGSHSDEELWEALELTHLKHFISSQPQGLDHTVDEDGVNFSVGQRQLVCLARALLRDSPVLVLDEATAAVDLHTDHFIQKTIRSQFTECTVLTIAHRLNTIMDYDRVMVLQGGRIAEFDTPAALLRQPHSIFNSMAKDAGLV